MNSHSNTGRSRVIRDVMAQDISVRKATKGVNAVFACMTRALGRGEQVEIPGGWIQTKEWKGEPRRERHRFKNVNTGEPMLKFVSHKGTRKIVNFTPDEDLNLASPELATKQEELEQLFSQLMGQEITVLDLEMLLHAVEDTSTVPTNLELFDRLLARLREIVKRGSSFTNISLLLSGLRQLTWIR